VELGKDSTDIAKDCENHQGKPVMPVEAKCQLSGVSLCMHCQANLGVEATERIFFFSKES